MATISIDRPITVNPDWGVDNLLKAIDRGPVRMSDEEREEARKARKTTFTEEEKIMLRKNNGIG